MPYLKWPTSQNDFAKFLDYARASIAETISHCYVALDQNYITNLELLYAFNGLGLDGAISGGIRLFGIYDGDISRHPSWIPLKKWLNAEIQ